MPFFDTTPALLNHVAGYRILLETLSQGIMVLRAVRNHEGKAIDLEYEFLNTAAEAMIGKKSADLLGKTFLQIWGADWSSYFEWYLDVIETGNGGFREDCVIYSEKSTIYLRITSKKFLDGIVITCEDISFHKRMQEELLESQRLNQSIADAAPNILFVYDLIRNENIYVNYEFTSILGYSCEKAKELINASIVHPEDKPCLYEMLRQLLASDGGESRECDLRVQAMDQSWRWLRLRVAVYKRTAEGKVGHIIGSAKDISERKKALEELKQNQNLLASIADATPDVIMVIEIPTYQTIFSNHELAKLLDCPYDEVKQLSAKERSAFVHKDDRRKEKAYLESFTDAKDDEIREVEYRINSKLGYWRWLWIRGKIFNRLPDGKTMHIICIGQDITEKKVGEEKLQQANKQLQEANDQLLRQQNQLVELNTHLEEWVKRRTRELEESAQRFLLLLESIPQMAWTTKPDGRVEYFNRRWLEFAGLSETQSLDEGWKKIQHPNDLPVSIAKWHHCIETGEEYVHENRFRRSSDGAWRWHLSRALPIRNASGEITMWIGTSTDTHDLKTALEDLSKTNALLDNFVYMAAHDLKSPVANLKVLIQLLQGTADKDNELLAAIQESVRRLDGTIEGLVEVIEIQSYQDVPIKLVTFESVMEHLRSECAVELEKSECRLIADFSQYPVIRYIESYLFSILRNLLTNAIKYRSSRKALEVSVKVKPENEFVLLTISDTGMGMDMEKYGKNLFKPFTRFTAQAQGKGLGLHLVKTMVEKNGGKISVESKLDQGTTFYIYLKEYPETSKTSRLNAVK